MRENRTKRLLREGKVAFSISQTNLASPEVTRMLAKAGMDWVFVDSEHSAFGPDALNEIIKTALLTDITPIVRVADFQYDLVARSLDSGAEGIIFPRTESAEALRTAVSWTRFPPVGIRGYGLGMTQLGYEANPMDKVIEHRNREVLVIAQIESTVGLANLDEIAAVEGLDSLLVGPADLSISLGVPGQWDSPKLLDAIDQVVAACVRHGKWPAIQVRNLEFAQVCIEHGMKLIGCASDTQVMWEAVSGLAGGLNAARGD